MVEKETQLRLIKYQLIVFEIRAKECACMQMCMHVHGILRLYSVIQIVDQFEIRDYIFQGTKRLVISLLLFGSIWKQACIAPI